MIKTKETYSFRKLLLLLEVQWWFKLCAWEILGWKWLKWSDKHLVSENHMVVGIPLSENYKCSQAVDKILWRPGSDAWHNFVAVAYNAHPLFEIMTSVSNVSLLVLTCVAVSCCGSCARMQQPAWACSAPCSAMRPSAYSSGSFSSSLQAVVTRWSCYTWWQHSVLWRLLERGRPSLTSCR